jgi:uncharacterized protein YehS (DUF1456 family)
MTNNDIMKKLRVALKLRNTDIIKILALVDFKVTESELGHCSVPKIIRTTCLVATRYFGIF